MVAETLCICCHRISPPTDCDDDLRNVVHYFQTPDHLALIMQTVGQSKKILVCHHESLMDFIGLILKYSFNKLFVLTDGAEIFYPSELLDDSIRIVEDDMEIHSIYRILGEVIVYYYQKHSQYAMTDNHPLKTFYSFAAHRLWHRLYRLK